MSLLAIPRSTRLGTLAAYLALPSWAPFSALVALDALTLDMAQLGGGSQYATLWDKFNSDAVILAYSGIYGLFHFATTAILAAALFRARVIPSWAAAALIFVIPFTFLGLVLKFALPFHVPALLLIIGSLPAAVAMFRQK